MIRLKTYINTAEITEIVLTSKTITAISTSNALTSIVLPCSVRSAFATAIICGSLSKTKKN